MNARHYLRKLWLKSKYDPLARLVIDALAKIGIRFTPYYIVLEGLSGETIAGLENGFEEYETTFLGTDDMKAIAALPGRSMPQEKLLDRLEKGQVCYGVKYKSRPVAFNWFDLLEFNYMGHRFTLKENEAYLFDAYTDMDFRGKGLAPYVRYQTYKELERTGRTRLYSVSDYFNASSIKFKKKLNAKFVELHWSLICFKKWRFRIFERRILQ